MAIDINIPSQVKNYANLAAFPATGTLKTIFIAEDTNKTYRWTGSSYVEISPAGATGITIGTTAITSGTVGRVLFEGTGNVVQESANLFWDNTNGRLGIGTSSPAYKFDVVGDARVNSTGGQAMIISSGLSSSFTSIAEFNATALTANQTGFIAIGRNGATNNQASLGFFYSGNGSAANRLDFGFYGQTPRMAIFAGGNISIGNTTDAGFKLDVNGTARVQGETQIGLGTSGVINNLLFNSSRGGVGLRAGVYWSSGASIINRRKFSGGNDNTLSFSVGGTPLELMTIQEHNGTVTTNNVGINNTNPNVSAVLDVASTTQGFLPPRMTTTQKNAIASPATGLMVYDTTLNLMALYNGTTWTTL